MESIDLDERKWEIGWSLKQCLCFGFGLKTAVPFSELKTVAGGTVRLWGQRWQTREGDFDLDVLSSKCL